ncbi:MAG: CHAT domain-containing protein [Acidobacteriota bacterium]
MPDYNIPKTSPRRVLVLSTNPEDTERLALERETRQIERALAHREGSFTVRHAMAAHLEDLEDSLFDFKPQYVHFCGHGLKGGRGLAFQDDSGRTSPVTTRQLKELFSIFKTNISCVFLNCCFSRPQAEVISAHVPYVIGTSEAFDDELAVVFASKFYKAIGRGKTVPFAFKFARAVTADNLDSLIPVLVRGRRKNKTNPGDSVGSSGTSQWKAGNLGQPKEFRSFDLEAKEEQASLHLNTSQKEQDQDARRASLSRLWNRLEQKREAVIFLGSAACAEGFKEGKPYPSLDAIAKRILDDEGRSTGNMTDVRKELRNTLRMWTEGEGDLSDFLRKYISGQPGAAHHYLAALALGLFPEFNLLLFVTAGFDDLMEEAFVSLLRGETRPKIRHYSIGHQEETVPRIFEEVSGQVRKGVPVILKLFGDLDAESPLLYPKTKIRQKLGSSIQGWFSRPVLFIDCGPEDKAFEDLFFKTEKRGPLFVIGKNLAQYRNDPTIHHVAISLMEFGLEFLDMVRSKNQDLLKRVEDLLHNVDPLALYPDCESIMARAAIASRASLLRVEERLPRSRSNEEGHAFVPIARIDTQPDFAAFLRDGRPLLALIGDSGSGKSTLFYQVHQAAGAFISIFYDIHQLQATRTLAGRLAHDFLCDERNFVDLVRVLDKALKFEQRKLVIFIDGLNESLDLKPSTLRFEIEDLGAKLPGTIKIAYSCRRVYWDNFIRNTSPLSKELYFNSKEIVLEHFSPREAESAFKSYQELYGFLGNYASLSSEFKLRIKDPLMLRMLAEGYAGKKLPDFAPAVLIFDTYHKRFRQRFKGTVVPAFLDALVAAKVNETEAELASDQFITEDVRTHPKLSLLIQQQMLNAHRGGDPLLLLEDEGILTAIDDDSTSYRFAYDRFFEYLLGKSLSKLLTTGSRERFRERLEKQIRRLSPFHFSFLQALKSEVIRLNILEPSGPCSFYDPELVRGLLENEDAGIVAFTKDLLRELMFEGGRDLTSVIAQVFQDETANQLLMLDIAPDSPRTLPLVVRGLMQGAREIARRCCHILVNFLSEPESRRLIEDELFLELRRPLQVATIGGMIYYSAALAGEADRRGADPLPIILDFWRRAWGVAERDERDVEALVGGLVRIVHTEAGRFFGDDSRNAMDYIWTGMPREIKDVSLQMVPFIVDSDRRLPPDIQEILLFFGSTIRDWSTRRDPAAYVEKDYKIEFTMAQWILVQRARHQYSDVKETLESFVATGYSRSIEVALSNMESCCLHMLLNDKALLNDAYQTMLKWMPIYQSDEQGFYGHLAKEDPFSRNECPIDMVGRISLLDEFSPKEGRIPFLEPWFTSLDRRDRLYALICARKLWRHQPVKMLQTLEVVCSSDDETVASWLDVILKEIYMVLPRLVEEFFRRTGMEPARAQRIKTRSDVVDPSAVVHPGEPLYKALFLGPRERRKKLAEWYLHLLQSDSLEDYCDALARWFISKIHNMDTGNHGLSADLDP